MADKKRILDAIKSPADLKILTDDELAILAHEIRQEILAVTSCTGGHVASSLGAVETILAVHSLINAPEDKLLFDVGHQAYAHKIITGRLEEFQTLRQFGGVSGFPKPSESPYDVHPSGHASDSLSVALGLARARDARGSHEKVVAIIGDASIAGGMAFEALNHIGQEQTPMLIILNDNEMSISKNVGALMKHLGFMRASADYRNARDNAQALLEEKGALGKSLVAFGRNAKESMKQFVIPDKMLFEQLGIVCTPPIDGHDIPALKETLRQVLDTNGPVLMHVVTKKGAGYEPAIANPERFHGVGPFDLATGADKKKPAAAPSYTSVFGDALIAEAEKNERIFAITAAMKGGTGLSKFADKFPDRFIDTGIAEGHAVGLASGLAFAGAKPVVAVYSTFLQRAFDQIATNVALPNLDVVFAVDRAGLVGEDGPTHHGVFDMAYMRMIPNMKVIAPSDEAELVNALHTALATDGPVAVRYPRGAAEGVPVPETPELMDLGVARVVREGAGVGSDVSILAFGCMVKPAKDAADLLEQQGVSVRVVDMRWVKPLDAKSVHNAAKSKLVVTLEDGIIQGGAGAAALEYFAREGQHANVLQLGIPDQYVQQGSISQLRESLNLDAMGIAASILAKLETL